MKKFVLFLSAFAFSSTLSANDDLAASMKIIGEQFKVLAGAIQTQSLNEEQLQAVEVMQAAIADSALLYPDEATDDASKVQYLRWMAELMRMAITLQEQGELVLSQDPQNMADMTQTLMDMNELRKEAHAVFKTE